jgi:hypothetical protein
MLLKDNILGVKMKRIDIKARYNRFRLLVGLLIFASVIWPIASFLILRIYGKISVFLALPLIHLWWFAPGSLGYLPFFSRGLLYRQRTMKGLFYLSLFWPVLMFFFTFIDNASNLSITKFLLGSLYISESVLIPIISIVLTIVPLPITSLYNRFFSQVNVKVLTTTRKKVIAKGHSEQFYTSPYVLKQGLPILVENRTRNSITISHVILAATTLDVPISFLRRTENRGLGCFDEIYILPKWEVVDVNTSKLLYIPWKNAEVGSLKAIELSKKEGKNVKFYVTIYDPFSNTEYISKEIEPFLVLSEKKMSEFERGLQ